MLTPEKIKAFDEIAGTKTPVSGASSRADEIRALGTDNFRTLKEIAEPALMRVGREIGDVFKPDIPFGQRMAETGELPLRAAGAAAEIAGGVVGEPIRAVFEKLPEEEKQRIQNSPLSKLVQKIGALTDKSLKEGKTTPELVQTAKDVFEAFSWVVGGRAAKTGVEAAKPTIEAGIKAGEQALGAVIRTGKEAIETGLQKGKEIITGRPILTGEAKISDDALRIAREEVTPEYERKAALEKRTFTEGKIKGEVKYRPTRKEELLADSVRPLVEQGRIKPDALPFENIPEISLEVNRINAGVKEMLFERKVPFNENQLRSKLSAVKRDSEIIFTTDPTLERTYNALIEAFIKDVKKMDTLGLFEARQSFDKLPAVKKLLDGLKGATGENLRRQAVLDIRRAANDYVSDLLPEGNPYKPLLKQESYMIEVMTNLAERSKGLGGTTNIERFVGRHPLLKWTIRQAIPFGAGAAIF